jgi:SAM-dependent methyltransferase
MAETFKDHFSTQAGDYGRFRPDYPEALFAFLAELAPSRQLAHDVATGNGQGARQLARQFRRVIATDASAAQIAEAAPHPAIDFRVATAEASGLDDASVDLITVAQAAHWFDMRRFNLEARRVLRPSGVLALWCYGLMRVSPAVDAVVLRLYADILGDDYWPPERKLVESGYAGLPFPFERLAAPSFAIARAWSLPHLLGYLGTWSAVAAFRQRNGTDPLALVADDLASAWGDAAERRVAWPLTLLVGRREE